MSGFETLAILSATVLGLEEFIDKFWNLDGLASQIRTVVLGAASSTLAAWLGWGMFGDPAVCGGNPFYVCGPLIGLVATIGANMAFNAGPLVPKVLESLKLRPKS